MRRGQDGHRVLGPARLVQPEFWEGLDPVHQVFHGLEVQPGRGQPRGQLQAVRLGGHEAPRERGRKSGGKRGLHLNAPSDICFF